MSTFNIQSDEAHARQAKRDVAESHGHLGLCQRCEGTGNELYWMFRKCSSCDGVGALELIGEEPEPKLEIAWDADPKGPLFKHNGEEPE